LSRLPSEDRPWQHEWGLLGNSQTHRNEEVEVLSEKQGLNVLCAIHELTELSLEQVGHILALFSLGIGSLELLVDERQLVYLPALLQQSAHHSLFLKNLL
jgi:hypothetical protein